MAGRVFWDANLSSTWLRIATSAEKRSTLCAAALIERGDQLLTSAMTIGEVLVRRLQTGETELARTYADLLSGNATQVITFDAEAAGVYALMRARMNVRPPDAIQLACAVRGSADMFVTNDSRLHKLHVPETPFIVSLDRVPF
jgi:predicted nucleic acid-binding protein